MKEILNHFGGPLGIYFGSLLGLLTNAVIFFFFGLVAYNKYALRWSAKTGRYSVPGHITWSQMIRHDKTYKAAISYSYKVDGKKYHGELKSPFYKAEQTVIENPEGKEIVVYYSKKDPWFSSANRPPSHIDIIGSAIAIYLLLPFVLINIVTGYIFWLSSVNE